MSVPTEAFFLDPAYQGTKQSQVQAMVAAGILSGRFRPGEKLPSSRGLARHLGISRITVTLAYNELLADDYLSAKGRSGYFVSETAPSATPMPERKISSDSVDWSRAIGNRFSSVPEMRKPQDWRTFKYPFIFGQADETLFDRQSWRNCALQALGSRDFESLTADQFDADDPQLVEYISRHTLARRGIAVRPEEVLVTMGAQNALWLTTQILLNQRRTAAVENPCYPSLRAILDQSRCRVSPIDVDTGGLDVEKIGSDIDVVFTTPSHQCPTMATMPINRRAALLSKAHEQDFLIVEDDYDFEMSFLAPPLQALKSMDRDGRVIYVGSFSKSLFPGLRLGYLVGAEPFIREARALRSTVLRHPPGHIQRTAAYFLSLGHYDAMIRRMSRAFESRRRIMDQALEKHGLGVVRGGAFGGSSLWIEIPGIDTEVLTQKLIEKSVLIEPGRPFFYSNTGPTSFIRIAYSSIPEDRIEPGIRVIAETIGELAGGI